MTSPERHLDLDQLADVVAGEAPLGAQEHVAGCVQCRADLDELVGADTAVREQLAALAAIPLPTDVADRLTAALDAEGAADSPAAGTGAATVTPFPGAADAGPAKWLAAAAAVVVLLGGGSYGISRLGHGSGGAGSASSGAGADKAAAAPELSLARNSSGTDYRDRATLAAALPDLLAGRRQPAPAAAQLQGNAPSARAGANTRSVPGADPLAPLRDDKGLAECLLALLPPDDPSVQPLALDYASFRGRPALVVVMPAGTPNKLDVFVVGPTCSRANDSVLFYTSVDRP
jgi:hypothetical protein